MKINSKKARVVVCSLAVALLTLGGSALYAAQLDSTASVEIVDDLTLTQQNALDFGTIIKPSDVDDTFTLSFADSSVTKNGASNGAAPAGGGQRGEYLLSGESGYQVNVTATVLNDFGDPGVNLQSLDVENGGLITLDAAGDGQANVGGTVQVTTTAVPNTYQADIQITAAYQ